MMRPKAGETLVLGEWSAERRTGRLARPGEVQKVEPKLMELLFLLAEAPGAVFSRSQILGAVWPGITVGEDTLARAIYKLRRALKDDPRAPRFVETVPKRGYRLRKTALGQNDVRILKQRAEAFYFQFTRDDNESAIVLYERLLALDADDPIALAGLANGLVQRAVRWVGVAKGAPARTTLGAALACGVLTTPDAADCLARAQGLARRAVQGAPDEAEALKALGLVLAALGRLDESRAAYERALVANPKAWGVIINLADLDGLQGRPLAALDRLEQAHRLMSEVYDEQIIQVRPWHAALGVMIGDRHDALGARDRAASWYRRVLVESPLHKGATDGLARLLEA